MNTCHVIQQQTQRQRQTQRQQRQQWQSTAPCATAHVAALCTFMPRAFMLCAFMLCALVPSFAQAQQHSQALHTIKGPEGIFLFQAFSPDGQRFLTTANDEVKLWDTKTGKELLKIDIPHNMGAIAFSPDGTKLLAAAENNTAKVWDAHTGRELFTLTGHNAPVVAAYYFPHGEKILTLDADGVGRMWDAHTGQVRHRGIEGMAVQPAIFSSDGSFATRTEADDVIVWDPVMGLPLAQFKGHKGLIMSLAFSPDDTRIVTGAKDSTAKVWDVATGKEVYTLPHADFVDFVTYSPDGTHILTHAWDSTLKLWDARTGKEVFTLQNIGMPVSYSPDGQTLLVASRADNTAKLLDARTGKELASFGGVQFIQNANYAPNGQRLAIGSNSEVTIWGLD